MSNLLEVLVTSDSSNTNWTCCIWDPHTGTNLMTYKGGGFAELKTLSFIGDDYLAAVDNTKPILHVWPLNSSQTVQDMRFVLPGRANAFSFSNDGAFCAAGIDEKIYLWQIASGNLLTILNRHYQKVNLIKFTNDGLHLISAAEDCMVIVWSLEAIAARPEIHLVNQSNAGQHDPVYIISDHSLPVTDLYVSKSGILGRLCTVSTDRTCKIYDLPTGDMLLNVVFDVGLSSVVMDVLELNVFVGNSKGTIHKFSLTDPVGIRDFSEENSIKFSSHTKSVTCLSVSLDGETLMSGSQDGQVILWHIKSTQPIRIIQHKGPITNAMFVLNRNAIYRQDFKPKVMLHSLKRTLEKDSAEITELEILVNRKINFWPLPPNADVKLDEFPKEKELEARNSQDSLKKELDKLKKINANLYSYVIEKTLSSIPLTNNVPKISKKKKKDKKLL